LGEVYPAWIGSPFTAQLGREQRRRGRPSQAALKNRKENCGQK